VNLLVERAGSVAGTIYDVSISGISVDAEAGLPAGSMVRIEGEGFLGEGVVQHCSECGGRYRIGVALTPL
jgi:hypothetical protein